MSNRNIVTVEVTDLVSYEDEVELPLVKVIEDLQEALAGIPEEHRGNAVMRVSASGEGSASATVHYTRQETDEELASREAREQHYKAQRDALELREYERLRAKFSANPTR
jgi:hypothetical protein